VIPIAATRLLLCRASVGRYLARRCWHPPAANKTPLSQGTRRTTTSRPTASFSFARKRKSDSARSSPGTSKAEICAIPTTGGGPSPRTHGEAPRRRERTAALFSLSCLRTTEALERRDVGPPGCCYRTHPSVGGLGAARLLSLSRLLRPGYRNTTRRIRRLGLAGRDAYADLAIVWVLTVVRRCGLRLGRRCRVGEGEQIRLQARSVPYEPRLPGVTDSMEH
jgi:hypothetical protein